MSGLERGRKQRRRLVVGATRACSGAPGKTGCAVAKRWEACIPSKLRAPPRLPGMGLDAKQRLRPRLL